MVPNQENMEGDQPVHSHSHAQQPLVQEHCPGETGLPLSLSRSWKETMQLVSEKVEFNARQVSLL